MVRGDELTEEQILAALERLSPEGKRRALRTLLRNLGGLERLVEQNRVRLDAICRERGIDFDKMTEEEREQLIDELLH